MANDYRDPQVTETNESSTGKWIAMLVGAIIVLALLGWVLGWFGTTDVAEADLVDPEVEAVVVTDEAEAEAVATPELVDTADISDDADLVVEEEVATDDAIVLENNTTVVEND